MKVLLVHPVPPRTHWPVGGFRTCWAPTGMLSLASALRRSGHDVALHVREEHLMKRRFDWAAADADLRQAIVDFRPEMVGLSTVTAAMAETQTIAALAKELCGPATIAAAGGPHPSAMPERTLVDCPALDAAAVGEGERTIVELADHGVRTGVPGLAVRIDGQIVPPASAAEPIADLDSLGDVPYDLLDMAFYTQRNRYLIRWMDLAATNVRTSRGCTNRCRFCGGHLVAGLGVRTHSLERVIAQIERLAGAWPIEGIHFEDDTLGADRDRLMRLCEMLRSRGLASRLKWDGCLRVDQADAELLRAMRSAGCVQVEYGLESGSDESLRGLGKGVTSEQNRRAVAMTREAGLRVFADIMVGLPGQTREDFRRTVKFVLQTKPEVVSAVRLYPLPGTAVYEQLPESVRASLRWEDFTYFDLPTAPFNLTAMSDKEFAEEWRQFSRYVLRPMYFWQLLRDSRPDDVEGRKRLRRRLVSFCIRHPLRAAAVFRKEKRDKAKRD